MKLEQQFVDFKDRLARLEQQVRILKDHSHKHKDESDCVYPYNPDYKPPVPPGECEHSGYICFVCEKCGTRLPDLVNSPSDEPKCVIEPDCTCHNDMWTCRRHPERNKGCKQSDEPKCNSVSDYFKKLRFDPAHHIGMGDIRLTMGQQEEIVGLVEKKQDTIHALNDKLSMLTEEEDMISISRNIAIDFIDSEKWLSPKNREEIYLKLVAGLRRAIGKGKV